jgi:hypothetical protein
MLDVRGEGGADIRGERKCGQGTSFPSDRDLCACPIQIIELKTGHFARPQSQPREY